MRRWGIETGLLVSAALFGIIHLDAFHSTFAFFLGLFLGWIAERAASVRPTAIAHAVNNVLSFLFARWLSREQSILANIIGLAISAAVLGATIWALGRLLPRTSTESASAAGAALPARGVGGPASS